MVSASSSCLWPLLAGLAGDLANMPDVVAYGIILCIGGLVLVTMGTRRGLRYWPALVYLLFMLPLPAVVYWRLSISLQLLSSEIGVWLISAFGVPVNLAGNVIDLGVYKLQVAEACSGLRYLFPLMSFGYLFAVLYKGPFWQKLVLFLSTIPITILMNSFRIGVIGILVDRFGIAQAEGFLHLFEGWIIFVVCVVVLYAEAVLLQLMLRKRIPVHRMLEIDFGCPGQPVSAACATYRQAAPSSCAAIVLPLAGAALHLSPPAQTILPGPRPAGPVSRSGRRRGAAAIRNSSTATSSRCSRPTITCSPTTSGPPANRG